MLEWKDLIDEEVPVDDSASEGERLLLYSLIRSLQPQVVVETGTHKGLSTLYMASALHDNEKGTIYTADPGEWGAPVNFRKFPELEKLIKFFPVRGDEMEVDDKIDFWFCDGLHEQEEIVSEFNHLSPQFSKKFVVVFHDAGGDNEKVGVHAAVKELGLDAVLLPTHNRILLYSNFTLPNDGLHQSNMLTSYAKNKS